MYTSQGCSIFWETRRFKLGGEQDNKNEYQYVDALHAQPVTYEV